jgi:hypothetical protein
MFYFIPVKINQRRYFVAQLRQNNTHTHHFIIRKGQPDIFSLFNAGGEWKHLYASHGADKNVVLQFNASEDTLQVELLDKERVEMVTAAPPPAAANNQPVAENGQATPPAPAVEEEEDNLNNMIRSIFGRRSSNKNTASGSSDTGTATGTQTIFNRESLDALSAAARNIGLEFAQHYILRNRSYKQHSLKVVLQYTDEQMETYQANFQFHFQQEQHPVMYHMLDFGSEASQIARCYPDRDQAPYFPFKVVDELEKLSGMKQSGRDPNQAVYLQEEMMGGMGRQEYLYSSKIFIRKRKAVFSETDKAILFNNNVTDSNVNDEGHSLVNMLTSRANSAMKDHYNILPNLKILSFMMLVVNNMEFEDIEVEQRNPQGSSKMKYFEETNFYNQQFDKKIYNAILNSFLYLIINKVKKGSEEGLLDLNLLVPNIYGQHKISELYKSIETDLPILIEKEGLQDAITGFEIHIISESDASFLGMMNERFFHEQAGRGEERYLVVDSGKGTTDFSIVRKNPQNRYDSIYRSGIPGAGNVLTYAFLETVAHAVTSGREKKHVIRKLMSGKTTLAERLRVSEALEELKRTFGTRTSLDQTDIKNLVRQNTGEDQLNYEKEDSIANFITILEAIKTNGTLADSYGYIEQSAQYLAGEVVRSLSEIDRHNEMRFNKVYLSGRAFLFAPFRKQMEEKLLGAGYIQDRNQIQVPGNMKDVCIRGSVKGDLVNYDSGIIGLPLLSAYFNHPSQDKKPDNKRWYTNMFNWVSGSNTNGNLSTHVTINDQFFYKHPDHNINLKDFGLNEDNRVLRFKIGRYSYMADFSDNDIYEWNLLFNGEEMVFKDMTANRHTVHLKRIDLDDADRDTCYKSLVPYISNHSLEPPVSAYTETEPAPRPKPQPAPPPPPEPAPKPAPVQEPPAVTTAPEPAPKPAPVQEQPPAQPPPPPQQPGANNIDDLYNFL